MNVSGYILKLMGWKVNITIPDYPKCIICVAPHTSNWDFILGKLAYASINRHAGFMMKSTWFFPPLGWIFKAIGGVPVDRRHSTSLVDTMVKKFNDSDRLQLAITPEGTRSRVTRWRTGFLRIAYQANVPVALGVFDYKNKIVSVTTTSNTTGDTEQDLREIKAFYRGANARYPKKFTTDDE